MIKFGLSICFSFFFYSVKKTVACCKNVLKDYWQSLRVDLTEKSEVWIEEAKQKRLIELIRTRFNGLIIFLLVH
jgi:hypothetical protein